MIGAATADAAGMAAEMAAAIEDWPERQPLPDVLPEVPALPDELLPEALRGWIIDAAGRMQVPAEMIAAPALVAAGAVVGRTIALRPMRHDDRSVLATRWGMIVGRPGTLKSPAMTEATAHVRRLAAHATEQYQQALQTWQAQSERIGMEIEQARRAGRGKTGDAEAAAARIAALQAEAAQLQPVERRYMTQDPTTEALGVLLANNPRGLLLMRDELHGWLAGLDRQGREGDRALYLEAWEGRGSYTYDRIGRGTIHIPSLTVSVLGTIQPGRLRGYIAEAVCEGRGDDGLLQRMQVTVWPDIVGEWSVVDRRPDAAMRDRAWRAYQALDALDPRAIGAAGEDGDIPWLRYDEAAQALAYEWMTELERGLRGETYATHPAYLAHRSKYRSLMPALALLLHLLDVVDGQAQPGTVRLLAAQRAAEWVEYLDAHARRVYAVELDPGRAASHALAARIKSGAVPDGMDVRDIRRAEWSGLATADAVDAALAELQCRGWLRVVQLPTEGRPRTVVRLHPELREMRQ